MKRSTAFAAIFTVALLAGPFVVAYGQTGDETLGGFGIEAIGAGKSTVYVNPDSPTSVAGNAAEIQSPYSRARLSTGPTSSALASNAYPGELVSNADTVGLPGYPVQARASYPGGNEQEETSAGSATMTAEAGPERAEAIATEGSGGSAESQGADYATRSTTFVAGGEARGETVSSASNIVVGEGVFRVDSVRSVAEVVSTGDTANANASTVVSGVTVAGQPAQVDEDGVTFTGQGADLLGEAGPSANEVLAQAGIEVFVASPSKTVDNGEAIAEAGGLIVVQRDATTVGVGEDIRDALVVAPPTTGTITQSYAQAFASVGASEGFGLPPLDDLPTTPTVAPTTPPATPEPTVSGGGDQVFTAPEPADTGGAPAAPDTGDTTGSVPLESSPLAFESEGVALLLILAAVATALGASWGIRRVYLEIFGPEPTPSGAQP